jgi:pimeloyl-ACP methyl ester carboxylesterase
MSESTCIAGDVELCYQTFGDPGDTALLLVMGLGTQMLWWREAFCETLAERGFHVVRYDNRDVGRSSRLSHAPLPTAWQLLRRDRRAATYTLSDMAGDGLALLDHLGIHRAHVVGASMGGMIAQTMAVERPERVLSLVSMMSNTGAWWAGRPALRLYPRLITRPPAERDTYVEQSVRGFRQIASPGFEWDEEEHRQMAAMAFDRMLEPAASTRQLAAILASGDRTPLLRRITTPTLVIHGTADRLVRPSGGRATAKAIPGARLMMIEGMGHDLPRGAWPRVIDGIVANAARAADRLSDEAQVA